MTFEIILTEEDMQLLHAGTAVTKSVRGGVVRIIFDDDTEPEEPEK